MANNYTLSSTMLMLPKSKLAAAKKIIARERKKLEAGAAGYVGAEVVVEADGVWISHNETCDSEHVIQLFQALLDGLKIDAPLIVSFAFECSKPRLDEFGGMAVVLQRGKDPEYFDAQFLASKCVDQREDEMKAKRVKGKK